MESCTEYLSQLTDKELIDLARKIGMDIPDSIDRNRLYDIVKTFKGQHGTNQYSDKGFKLLVQRNSQAIWFSSSVSGKEKESLSIDDFGGIGAYGFDAKQGADKIVINEILSRFEGSGKELSDELLIQARESESDAEELLEEAPNYPPEISEFAEAKAGELVELANFYRLRANYITTLCAIHEQESNNEKQ